MFRLDDRLDPLGPVETKVVAITGPGTAFPDDYGFTGTLPPDLIMLIELANSELAWSQPGDLPVSAIPASITQGLDGRGVHVAFADGSVWYLKSTIPLATLRNFVTIEGARSHDRDQELKPYREN